MRSHVWNARIPIIFPSQECPMKPREGGYGRLRTVVVSQLDIETRFPIARAG